MSMAPKCSVGPGQATGGSEGLARSRLRVEQVSRRACAAYLERPYGGMVFGSPPRSGWEVGHGVRFATLIWVGRAWCSVRHPEPQRVWVGGRAWGRPAAMSRRVSWWDGELWGEEVFPLAPLDSVPIREKCALDLDGRRI